MFKFLKKKEKPENIDEIIELIEGLKKENENLKREIKEIKEESAFFIKSLEITRYNPFSNIGGDQSFSVVFLDKNKNGAVITSLYTGEVSRVYAKFIEKGVSKHSLSEQEDKILKKALSNERK